MAHPAQVGEAAPRERAGEPEVAQVVAILHLAGHPPDALRLVNFRVQLSFEPGQTRMVWCCCAHAGTVSQVRQARLFDPAQPS
jgi:hypothetical protein